MKFTKRKKRAVGPHRRCGKRAIAEARARRQWRPICRKHAVGFRSLFGEEPTVSRFLEMSAASEEQKCRVGLQRDGDWVMSPRPGAMGMLVWVNRV